MSNGAITWAYEAVGIKPLTKFVLVTMANWSDENGFCYPGMDSLAGKCNMGKRTVVRAVSELEKHGLIAVTKRGGFGQGRASNQYRLQLSAKLAHCAKTGEIKGAKCQTGTLGLSANYDKQSANYDKQSAKLAPDTSVDTSVHTNPPTPLKTETTQNPAKQGKPSKHSKTPKTPKKTALRFDEFWAQCLKKVDKPESRIFWVKNNLDEIADEIIGSLMRLNESDYSHRERKHILSPWRWLKRKKWTDEVTNEANHKTPAQSRNDMHKQLYRAVATGELDLAAIRAHDDAIFDTVDEENRGRTGGRGQGNGGLGTGVVELFGPRD
ncbi:MAG: hypothetical protein GY799_25235 [Desulfobulbaceae bacterium]|nr:hypothetical protein [Desulfobulbaceae bacterium]